MDLKAFECDSELMKLIKEINSSSSPKKVKPATLVLIFNKDKSKVLLGHKKRGFGVGLLNGFGGKIEPQETDLEGAERELEEEAGIKSNSLKKIGVLYFEFESDPVILTAHVFTSAEYSGEIIETEEMRPDWFDTNNMPFDRMWNDDKFWFSYAIESTPFIARFYFKSDLKTITDFKISKIDSKLLNEIPVWHNKE
ncbi:7,8-dihydro-8-oxoguanine triphosphatase [Smittium culicis]|uniref:Oxidized purine nucleoside triphosphate hydrolase n=1 Tax=Smittium culicis TaxID=133412 RepID=A0A1R1XWU1_9FUNG|nr:7,8-dihydro-8-oxoguanine triphosphatase [Smittium culicis]